jgi:protein KRI1
MSTSTSNDNENNFDSDYEDDEGVLLDETIDTQMFNVLNAIQRNDPIIYQKSTRFFDEEELSKIRNTDKKVLADQFFKQKKKDDQEELHRRQEALKAFHDAVDEEFTDDNDLFKKKQKSKKEKEQEEEDYQQFVKKEAQKDKEDVGKQAASLDYLENENLDAADSFLRDYLLNNRWRMKEDEKKNKKKNSGKKTASFEELARELSSNYDDDDEGYNSDGVMREQEYEDIEFREAELNQKNSVLPDLTTHRFQEKNAAKLPTTLTSYKSEEREKKLSVKARRDKNRKENKINRKLEASKNAEGSRKELQLSILSNVLELKKLVSGDNSVVDNLDLQPHEIENTDDIEAAWDKVERNDVVEELLYSGTDEDHYDDDQVESDAPVETDPTKRITQLKRTIQKNFSDYYDSFFTDVGEEGSYKFKYKRVDKDDFGMSAADILELEDEDLEDIVPIGMVRNYDAKKSNSHLRREVKNKLERKLSRSGPASKPTKKRKRKSKQNSEEASEEQEVHHQEQAEEQNNAVDSYVSTSGSSSHMDLSEDNEEAGEAEVDNNSESTFDDDFFSVKKKRKLDPTTSEDTSKEQKKEKKTKKEKKEKKDKKEKKESKSDKIEKKEEKENKSDKIEKKSSQVPAEQTKEATDDAGKKKRRGKRGSKKTKKQKNE